MSTDGPELMLSDELGGAPIVHRERLFDGRVWDVDAETFELAGREIRREVVVHPGAVAALVVDEQDRVLLVHQYRHPVRARMWELPAGLLDVEGEDPLVAAQRELAEEADCVAREWQTLVDISTTGGGSTEIIRVFLASGVSAAAAAFDRTDEEADMEVRWVPFEDVVDAALAMRLHNSVLLASVLALDAMRRRDRQAQPADVPFDWHLPGR